MRTILAAKFEPLAAAVLLVAIFASRSFADTKPPIGPPGWEGAYRIASNGTPPPNSVERFILTLGPEDPSTAQCQWLALRATKVNGEHFSVWILASAYPAQKVEVAAASVVRYLVQEGDEPPREFIHRFTGKPVLPSVGGWEYLWPRTPRETSKAPVDASRVDWLGQPFLLETNRQNATFPAFGGVRALKLLPDALTGVPSNARTKDNRRRYDGSDYEMVRLSRDDYVEMIQAGLTCFHVDKEQADWIKNEPVFFWGVGGQDVAYPECLYRSTYLGPALFLDEPAVGTRDYDVRPRLAKDPAVRRSLTAGAVLDAFKSHYHKAVSEGAPEVFIKGMQARKDITLGAVEFTQRNLYTWETMIASAAWQLTAEPDTGPRAIVFEPPGRIGSRRTVPEMNMVYGCQLSPESPAGLAGVIFGFLRGAARAADKDWGVSIYGGVDPSDAPWLLTHAYDLGATHFFFWDNYQSACVPYGECLALARQLQAHIQSHQERNPGRLKRAAEVAILLPPGYDLGHVQMGRGNLWGLGELNLERTNVFGVTYRRVMGNFFTEIERCLRLGVSFDLLWNLDGLKLEGYREVIRVAEDGTEEITEGTRRVLLQGPRTPERPQGRAPGLTVQCRPADGGTPRGYAALATVTEGSAPVYYNTGADRQGRYHNVRVLFELFGPGPEDYRQLNSRVTGSPNGQELSAEIETRFSLGQPGHYRLRAATTDLAGRSTVVWTDLTAAP